MDEFPKYVLITDSIQSWNGKVGVIRRKGNWPEVYSVYVTKLKIHELLHKSRFEIITKKEYFKSILVND